MENQPAKWNNFVVGVVVAVFSIAGASQANLVLGIWLIVSPFALGFSHPATMLWNNIILGVLIAIFALSTLLNRSKLRP